MPSLSILVPMSILPCRGVAKAPLPEGLVYSATTLLHEPEYPLALHRRRNPIALVLLVLARYAIHLNGISES